MNPVAAGINVLQLAMDITGHEQHILRHLSLWPPGRIEPVGDGLDRDEREAVLITALSNSLEGLELLVWVLVDPFEKVPKRLDPCTSETVCAWWIEPGPPDLSQTPGSLL